ncbi:MULTISPECIES: universal stress protein [Streptomyces]|uniref:Universal stress protein n=1 Tax=Streptomyces solicathayae TaxID=3081768 RepID=A0ABZ0LLH7_9ACTN|nr:universal stress protein [Streptomyces sp. HUAS YS2]WOX20031.1 universal stress protein [Streptomyces sp. HUAS YS2]
MDGTRDRPGLGRVVVGLDGSPSAQAAAMWAANEAVLRGSGLCLVHATDTDAASGLLSPAEEDRRRQAGRELLDRAAEAVAARHPDLVVVTELGTGSPVDVLRRAAALSGTIVVGHRGRGGFSSLLLGSVGLELAAGATTPVVVVRGAAEPAETGAVLAAIRDENDVGCARAAAREAQLREVPLRLFHVWGTDPYSGVRGALRNGADNRARAHVHASVEITDRLRKEFPGLALDTEGEKSHSVPGTLVEASRRADLVVVGGRRAPGYLGPTLGRTTLTLLQHARCPVELIPRHGPGHGSTS